MAVIDVTKMWSAQTFSGSSKDGKTYNVAYGGCYQILHEKDTTKDEILQHADMPQLRSNYSDASGEKQWVFLTNIDIVPKGPTFSLANVKWEGEAGPTPEEENPWNVPPEIEIGSIEANEATDVDGWGIPLCNINGEPVEGLTRPISDYYLNVARNYQEINLVAVNQYLDSTNSDEIFLPGAGSFVAGTGHLKSFTAKPVFKKDFREIAYWKVNARIEFRMPYNTTADRAWWHRYRNDGRLERVGVTVSFSGGGGSGAAGYAVANSSGVITKIVVTNPGSGYTSAPTVSLTAAVGSGFAGTAVLGTGDREETVASVTIGTAGTGYKPRLVKIVDDNKEPVSNPVMLSRSGVREKDASAAVWIERPKFTYSLPYEALGLLT